MNDLTQLMVETKASWQTRGGLRGPIPAQTLEERPPVTEFRISEALADTSKIQAGKTLPLRPNPDGTYMPT